MSEYPNYLIHYGIQGQKWGVRRFQNDDGTYTSEGLERRRKLEESGLATKSEIRRAGREGKEQAKYNKMLAKRQNIANKRFDKLTTRMENDKKAGLNPSERDIRRAVKLGTEVRKADYIAKDPQMYYNRSNTIRNATAIGAGAGAFAFGFPVGVLTGLASSAVAHLSTNRTYNRYYNEVFEKARNETIADLKKHKII